MFLFITNICPFRLNKFLMVVLDQKYEINFQNNYYFYAIPNKHLETNSKLEQTQDWDNGTFNPYE